MGRRHQEEWEQRAVQWAQLVRLVALANVPLTAANWTTLRPRRGAMRRAFEKELRRLGGRPPWHLRRVRRFVAAVMLQVVRDSWRLPNPCDDGATAAVLSVHANHKDFLTRLSTNRNLRDAPLLHRPPRVTIPPPNLQDVRRLLPDQDLLARGLRRLLPTLVLQQLGFRTLAEYEYQEIVSPLPLEEHVRHQLVAVKELWSWCFVCDQCRRLGVLRRPPSKRLRQRFCDDVCRKAYHEPNRTHLPPGKVLLDDFVALYKQFKATGMSRWQASEQARRQLRVPPRRIEGLLTRYGISI